MPSDLLPPSDTKRTVRSVIDKSGIRGFGRFVRIRIGLVGDMGCKGLWDQVILMGHVIHRSGVIHRNLGILGRHVIPKAQVILESKVILGGLDILYNVVVGQLVGKAHELGLLIRRLQRIMQDEKVGRRLLFR